MDADCEKKVLFVKTFIMRCWSIRRRNIPSVLNVSVVLVLPREQANYLIDHVSLRFNDKEAKLLDLVTGILFFGKR